MVYPPPPPTLHPPQKRSIVRAKHSVVSVMHHFSVVGRSRSKDLLIARLTNLVQYGHPTVTHSDCGITFLRDYIQWET